MQEGASLNQEESNREGVRGDIESILGSRENPIDLSKKRFDYVGSELYASSTEWAKLLGVYREKISRTMHRASIEPKFALNHQRQLTEAYSKGQMESQFPEMESVETSCNGYLEKDGKSYIGYKTIKKIFHFISDKALNKFLKEVACNTATGIDDEVEGVAVFFENKDIKQLYNDWIDRQKDLLNSLVEDNVLQKFRVGRYIGYLGLTGEVIVKINIDQYPGVYQAIADTESIKVKENEFLAVVIKRNKANILKLNGGIPLVKIED